MICFLQINSRKIHFVILDMRIGSFTINLFENSLKCDLAHWLSLQEFFYGYFFVQVFYKFMSDTLNDFNLLFGIIWCLILIFNPQLFDMVKQFQ